MGDGQPADLSVLPHQIHGAPVGHVRHGQVGHGRQCLLVLQRAAEQLIRLGEERRPLPPVGGDFVQIRGGDRRGGEVRQRLSCLQLDRREPVNSPVIERESAGQDAADVQRKHQHRLNALETIGFPIRLQRRLAINVGDSDRFDRRRTRSQSGLLAAQEQRRERLGDACRARDTPPAGGEVDAPQRVRVRRQQVARGSDRGRLYVLDRRRVQNRRGGRHQRQQPALEIGDSRLRALPLGDVARDLRRANHPSVLVANRRDGERDVEQRAVLALPHGLEVIDALVTPDSREHFVFLRAPLLWDDQGDRPANHLVGGVAEHLLRGAVPALDDAVEILAHDRVVGGLDDGGEAQGGEIRQGGGHVRKARTNRRSRVAPQSGSSPTAEGVLRPPSNGLGTRIDGSHRIFRQDRRATGCLPDY